MHPAEPGGRDVHDGRAAPWALERASRPARGTAKAMPADFRFLDLLDYCSSHQGRT